VEAVQEFNSRYAKNLPQKLKMLDDFAALLAEVHEIWPPIVANLIITSTLNLVTALLLERETAGMKISRDAISYPYFTRNMSGASDAYSLFAFPPGLPIRCYVQAIPDMVLFVNNVK
jgi:hypothetical protein